MVMVVLVPVLVEVAPPGLLVNIQVPVAGKLFKTTLPVGTVHVGCVIAPAMGGEGEAGTVLITILEEDDDVHPVELVTV
jgi:hypothetical protein